MTGDGEWDEDGLLRLPVVSRITSYSVPYLRQLFDAGALPGTFTCQRSRKDRRVLRSFIADWFAAIRFDGEPVSLEDFATRWKAEQAERKAA